MGPPGHRSQMQPCAHWIVQSLHDLIVSDARSAVFMVDLLARCSLEVLGDRQINRCLVVDWMTRHQCGISLAHRASFELHRKVAMRLRVACEHHQSAGIAVEPMHDACAFEFSGDSHGDTVRLVWTDARNGKNAMRFVDDDELRIEMHDCIAASYTLWLTLRSVTHRHIVTMIPLSVVVFVALFAWQTPAVVPPVTEDPAVWKLAEAGELAGQTQLTFPDRFIKAGEAYFSPTDDKIIFQAVEQPMAGALAEEFYSMFVADLIRDGAGQSTLQNITRISPPHSANTCGWFDASRKDTVVFASTLVAPQTVDAPGYQRATGRYKWQFPPEMRIVEVNLAHAADIASGKVQPKVIAGDGTAYVAECTTTRDGATLLYCTLATGQGDIMVKNVRTGVVVPMVAVPGYDGGPFFSADERQICYRSDRNGDSLLQVYVSDVVRDASGAITGATNERQLTANEYVNWAPYWHPDGSRLIYASSEVGHSNYEIFSVILPKDGSADSPRRERITQALGADVLPVFDDTGRRMMWTSQRGAGRSSQLWIADVVTAKANDAQSQRKIDSKSSGSAVSK